MLEVANTRNVAHRWGSASEKIGADGTLVPECSKICFIAAKTCFEFLLRPLWCQRLLFQNMIFKGWVYTSMCGWFMGTPSRLVGPEKAIIFKSCLFKKSFLNTFGWQAREGREEITCTEVSTKDHWYRPSWLPFNKIWALTATHKSEIAGSTMVSHDNKYVHKDMRVLQEYIREDLFYNVKFIYNVREDLKEGGRIFNDFKRKRGDDVGKHLVTEDQNARDTYFLLLWEISQKERVIVDGLSAK